MTLGNLATLSMIVVTLLMNVLNIGDVNLVSTYNTFADRWANGEVALHVHVRVRVIGKSISDDLCFLFERKGFNSNPFFKQDGILVPHNGVSDITYDRQITEQGSVLINIGKSANKSEVVSNRVEAIVWLRFLNDCPRIPINYYPIKSTRLAATLSELNFTKEELLTFIDGELAPITRFLSVSKNKLPDEVVEGGTEVVNNVASDDGKFNIHSIERIARYNIPGVITPYVELTSIGLLFDPSVKLRFESAIVLFGPPELSSYIGKVSNSGSHLLYYPQTGLLLAIITSARSSPPGRRRP